MINMSYTVYHAISKIDSFCGSCGCLLLRDKTPIKYLEGYTEHFDELFEKGDMCETLCYFCERDFKAPLYWIGDLPGYLTFSDGRIYSFSKRKFISPFLDSKKYLGAYFYLGNRQRVFLNIHRLVAYKYLPVFEIKDLVIRHKNDIRTDNRAINLEFGTQYENMQDKKRNRELKKRNL